MGADNDYVVVLLAPSTTVFLVDKSLWMKNIPSRFGPVEALFRTKFDDRGLSVPVPGALVVEIRGKAPSLDDAIPHFADTARVLGSILSVAANAMVGELDVELAFESTPGRQEREYIQMFIQDRGMPRYSRTADPRLTAALIRAVFAHDRVDRLLRACGQYQQAMVYWRPGWEALTLAHTYIGMENLIEVALDRESKKLGIDRTAWAGSLGLAERELGYKVRKEILFQGDTETDRSARRASDGFEHGFMQFAEIQEMALEVYEKAARYLRAAILDLAQVEESARKELDRFDPPFGSWSRKLIRGHLVGRGKLAAPGQWYPYIQWRSTLKDARIDPQTGDMIATYHEHFTALLGEGIRYVHDMLDVWGPRGPDRSQSDGQNP